jgi:endo-1,4-beta-xylanase
MEFFISMTKVAGAVLFLVILSAIISLFFKRFRAIGLISLLTIIILFIVAFLVFFTSRNFDRSYLLKSNEYRNHQIRSLADSANFYIGAIGDVNMMSRPEFAEIVNSVTPENALKMQGVFKDGIVGNYDFSESDRIVDFALSKNLRVRGHTLIWGKLSHYFKNPDLDLYLSAFPEEERSQKLKELFTKHITTVLNHYKDRIKVWEVVNEPLEIFGEGEMEENVYFRFLGKNYVKEAFRLAHDIDPTIKLYLNEILVNYHDKRAEGLLDFVREMQADGVPIHGIGLQSHMMFQLPDLENLHQYLKKIEKMGLEVELTEVDARLMLFKDAEDPYKAQAEFYGKLLEICLENQACKGITFWGFTDAHSWMDGSWFFQKPNEPYFYDHNMNPKPIIKTLNDVLIEYNRR